MKEEKKMKATLYSKKWMGENVSDYGIENGYIDYRCLAHIVGDIVLCNDITKLFYSTINNEYVEPEQVNGYIDNTDEINDLNNEFEELQEQLDELQEQLDEMEIETDSDKFNYIKLEKHIEQLQEQLDNINDQIEDLEREQEEPSEIYQYYIICDDGADFLQRYTNEIIYYIETLDIYVWGITHFGTSWDYVLTDIKIENEGEE